MDEQEAPVQNAINVSFELVSKIVVAGSLSPQKSDHLLPSHVGQEERPCNSTPPSSNQVAVQGAVGTCFLASSILDYVRI